MQRIVIVGGGFGGVYTARFLEKLVWVLHAMEEADNEPDAELRRRLLTFVVGGGGFSGVEVIAELNDFVRGAARHFRSIRQEDIQCVLVHSGERILPEITPGLAEYAQKLLVKRGVTLKLRDRIAAATAGSAVLKSGEAVPTRTLVCTVPAGPVPLLQSLECKKEKGRLLVDSFLQLEGHDGRVPPFGRGRNPRNASLRLPGLGALAHDLPDEASWNRSQMRVALDWFTALLFPAELVQLRVQASDNITNEHFEAGAVVFEQGDVGDRMYVIRKGQVEVLRDGVALAMLGPGEYFGEMALLSNLPRNATVRTTQPADVLAIAKGDFAKLLATFPEFGAGIAGLAAQRSEELR